MLNETFSVIFKHRVQVVLSNQEDVQFSSLKVGAGNASAGSSAAGSDFGADDEVTSAAVGLILDSLDDIHCLLEAKNKDEDFLAPVLEDPALRSLLNLYDQICNNSHRPFRYPPTDACQKLKDVLSVIDFFDDDEDMDDVDELRDILAHYHMRALLQVYFTLFENYSKCRI